MNKKRIYQKKYIIKELDELLYVLYDMWGCEIDSDLNLTLEQLHDAKNFFKAVRVGEEVKIRRKNEANNVA